MLVLISASTSIAWAEYAGTSNANAAGQGSSAASTGMSNTTAANASSGNVTIGVTAQNIAFNTSTITVPAGANVTIVFNNQDAGVPHNIAFYQTSAATSPIYVGEIFNGPKTVSYNFKAPSTPGTYFFRCDVHPSMKGDFIVK
jgi:plastocyanin